MDLRNITSNLVKEEYNSNICYGCLSSDRNLTQLSENAVLFLMLLGPDSACPSYIALCWECSAVLRKIKTFQERVQCAHNVLQQSVYYGDLKSLSTLTKVSLQTDKQIIHIDTAEEISQVLNDVTKPNERKRLAQPIVLLTNLNLNLDIKNENDTDSGSLYAPDTDTDDFEWEEEKPPPNNLNSNENDANTDVNKPDKQTNKTQETDTNTEANKTDEQAKKMNTKLARHCKMGKFVKNKAIDFENFEKHFTDIILTEEEMRSVNLGEKRGKKYSKEALCKLCNRIFGSLRLLFMHQTFYHLIVKGKSKVGPYKCKECKRELSDIYSLRKHWRQKHSEASKCNLCGFVLDPQWRQQHLATHEMQIKCNYCHLTFDTRHQLRRHYNALHTRFLCDHCNLKSSNKRTLAKHIRLNHMPLACRYCKKICKSIHFLYNHEYAHVKRKKPLLKPELAFCVECNKQYPSEQRYRNHLYTALVHNPNYKERRKEMPCPDCGHIFKKKYNLDKHYKIVHVGKTDHYCSLCNKYYSHGWGLRNHIDTVHLKIKVGLKDKFCDYCGRGFISNGLLHRHLRIHTGEKPYNCPNCPAAFNQRHPLVSHMKSQHKIADPDSILPKKLKDFLSLAQKK